MKTDIIQIINNLQGDSVIVAPHAEGVYGPKSTLMPPCLHGGGMGAPRPNAISLDFNFGASLMLLMFLLVLCSFFRKSFIAMLDCAMRFKAFWSFRREQAGVNMPFMAVLCLFTILTLALFGAELASFLSPPAGASMSPPLIFLLFGGVATGVLLVRMFCSNLVGTVSREHSLFADITVAQLLFFVAMGVVIVASFMVKQALAPQYISEQTFFMLLCSLLAGVVLLYLIRTLRLFLQWQSSLLFWLLYVCTFEVLPMVVAVKAIQN